MKFPALRANSLTAKVTLILIGLALTSVAVVALFANYSINKSFTSYTQEGPPSFVVNSDGTLTTVEPASGQGPANGMQGLMRHIMGGPEERFLAAVNQSLWGASIVVILIAAFMSIIVARRITSPVKHLTGAAKEIAAGKLGHRITVETKDEIGELAGTFNYMAETLDKNQQLNRQLLAGIAHELKTPLTILQGNLEAILDGVQKPTQQKIAALHTETALLNRLVNDLRELTLAEAGQLRLNTAPMELKPLTAQIVEMLQPMLYETGIKLSVKIPASLPLINADGDRITQVLYNLITNAIRHARDKGKIDVSAAAKNNGFVEITVKDNGEGIPAADIPHIFDQFYRVDEARARATGGTGMGLAITKLLVEAHGGTISASSEPGVETILTFTLPTAVRP